MDKPHASCLDTNRSNSIEEHRLRDLLSSVAEGRLPIDQAVDELRHLPYEDLGFAKVDHHRALRDWVPEVILG
jgi:NCAIR mutase (PurE)-related protein